MINRIHITTLGVSNLIKSREFYTAIGFKTSSAEDDPKIVFFQTPGVTLALYPKAALAEDINPSLPPKGEGFSGTTHAFIAKNEQEVDELLKLAEKAGGKIVKLAKKAFWGGYSGYFSDPDGYYWEVAYWEGWQFDENGGLVID